MTDALSREDALTECADSLETGLARINEAEYTVIFVCELAYKSSTAKAVATVLKAAPQSRIVYVGAPEQKEKIAEALAAGAIAFLPVPLDPFEVLQTFRRVLTLTPKQRPEVSDAVINAHVAELGRVISIMGPADNSGKTTVAINLAAALADSDTGSVCMVDLDFQFGDIHQYLGIKPHITMADLTAGVAVTKEHMAHCLTRIDLLASPSKPELAEMIDPAVVQSVLQQLRRMYSYVIVDTGAGFTETNVAVIDTTDTIVMVVTMDNIAAVKNIKIFLETLKKLNFPDQSITMILNRDGATNFLDIVNVQQALGRGFDMTLPNDFPAVMAAIHDHDTVIATGRSTKLAAGIKALAKSLEFGSPKPPVAPLSFVERVRKYFTKRSKL